MQKLGAFYFSGTGNTKYVVERLCELLKNDFVVSAHDVCSPDSVEELRRSEIVVIAFPVYGSAPPLPIREFVFSNAQYLKGKRIIVVSTQYMFSGDGAASLGRAIEKLGACVTHAEHFRMPNNISDCKIFSIKNGEELCGMLEKTNRKLEKFARKICDGTEFRRGFNSFSRAVGYCSQRALFRKHENEKRRLLKVDESACTGCGACVRACPVKNLLLSSGKAAPLGHCALCYRCVNLCPNKALALFGKAPPEIQYKGVPKQTLK